MRIATMIIALILMVIVGLQSLLVSVGGGMLGEESTVQGGSIGILMALLFLIGGAFILPFPIVSLISFLFAALFGFAAGATTDFTDLTIWAVVSLILAVLSFLGMREKRKVRQRSSERVS